MVPIFSIKYMPKFKMIPQHVYLSLAFFYLFFYIYAMTEGNCGKYYYYDAPTGQCRDCGWLCDTPASYPVSCDWLCPDYAAKNRVTPQPPSQDNSLELNIPVLVKSVSAFLILAALLYLLWKKVLKKKFRNILETFRNRKLRRPVQAQNGNDGVQYEMERLTSIDSNLDNAGSLDSVVGDFEEEVIASLNDIEANGLSPTHRIDELHLPNITYESENMDSFTSGDFNFGETFPFHWLESLDNVLEFSSDDTHRKS